MNNIYKAGALTTTKTSPDLQLINKRYFKRIYYHISVNAPCHKLLAYF